MDDDAEHLLTQLRGAGARVTPARRAVIEALTEVGPHPTADDLASHVARRYPDIHLSTVYRTLETLTELGIVSHAHLGHTGAAYHVGDLRNLHVVCDRCGAVAHVPVDVLTPAWDRIEADTGYALRPAHFALTGRCARCREERDGEAPAVDQPS